MIKVVGHRVRGQTRSTVLMEWSNKKATITSNVFFRYYRGAGWAEIGPRKVEVITSKNGRPLASTINRRLLACKAKGYIAEA